jgi:hypothetical protein
VSEKEGRIWIPGGNSGVMIRGSLYSNKGSSCIRKILLRNAKIKEPVDFRAKITFGIGNSVEDAYAEHLASDGDVQKGVRASAELNEGGQIYLDETDIVFNGEPYEIKSISSSKMAKQVFCEMTPSWDNVVQAFHHMVINKSYTGKLVYINTLYHSITYKGEKVKHAAGDIKKFHLEFDKKAGRASIESKELPFSAKDLIRWREYAGATVAAALEFGTWVDTIPKHPDSLDTTCKRPVDFELGVCKWCFWKEACDNCSSVDSFLDYCKVLAGG